MGDQSRKVTLDRFPYQAQVDVEVGMYESMTHANDFSPRDVRMPLPRFGAQAGRRFSDDLHRFENGELTAPVLRELGVRQSVREAYSVTGGDKHVQQK